MATATPLPFEYTWRWAQFNEMDLADIESVMEQHDRELEDYLARMAAAYPFAVIVRATEPTAADFGALTIPVGAVWVVTR